MKNKKLVASVVTVAVLLTTAGSAFASGFGSPSSHSIGIDVYNSGTSSYEKYDIDQPGSGYNLIAASAFDNNPVTVHLQSPFSVDGGGNLQLGTLSSSQVTGLDSFETSVNGSVTDHSTRIAASESTIASHTSSINSLSTAISAIPSPVQADYNATSTSASNFIKNKPLMQRTRATSDGSGNYTWTFPTAYSAAPIVTAIVEDNTSGALGNVQITAISSTSVTLHASRLTTILGLLTMNNNASIPIDIIAMPQ